MITETKLAEALENIMQYVVEAVFNCDRTHCNQPLCVDCRGDHAAKENASEVGHLVNEAGQVLREWKASKEAQKCDCDAKEYFAHWVIPSICPEYTGDYDYCTVCRHEKHCHQSKPEQPE
jgi:hypothetical protein